MSHQFILLFFIHYSLQQLLLLLIWSSFYFLNIFSFFWKFLSRNQHTLFSFFSHSWVYIYFLISLPTIFINNNFVSFFFRLKFLLYFRSVYDYITLRNVGYIRNFCDYIRSVYDYIRNFWVELLFYQLVHYFIVWDLIHFIS